MKKYVLLIAVAFLLLAGCTPAAGGSQLTQEDVDTIVDAIKETYGDDYAPNAPIAKEQLEEVFGIDMDNVEYFVAEGPEFSMSTDMLIVLMAKDGKIAEVEQDLKDYHEYLINESFQYPMNMARVKASQVVVKENVVFLVVLGKFDDRENVSEEEALEFAQEQVQLAVDVING
jgi:hypothetical protein